MSLFGNKTLMITGGTGSFGNAVLNRFLSTDIGEIRVFSRDEKKQDDMRHEFQAKMPEVAEKIKFYIGDVRDIQSVREAVRGVDYIFHAAALKQVPSCEFFPMEAVRTNVIGTDNVLTAAIEAGVECVICLSTDKAAYPINAMGITKAIEEKVAVAKSRSSGKTRICCTRYGNVMCSRGSVIPLWREQIRSEECAKAVDMGNYYRVPADNRGLNYDKYFKEGDGQRNTLTEFNSNNTRILGVEETKKKIASLQYIKDELAKNGAAK